jgi:subtilisin family serine protease
MGRSRVRSVVVAVWALAAVMVAAPPPAAADTSLASYVVTLDASHPAERVAAGLAHAHGGVVTHTYRHVLNGFAVKLPAVAAAGLAREPGVLSVQPDGEVRAEASGSAQLLPSGVDRIEGDLSSARSGDGRGSVNANIAVVDSGIDPAHPDLNVVGGVNCTSEKSYADGNGHGTHVAGIAAARDNGLGVVGVAPGARLWAVKVLDRKGVGKDSEVLCGFDWLAGTRVDGDPANDIAVANASLNSFGKASVADDGACGTLNGDVKHQAVCALTAAGVVLVGAAGNGARDFASNTPADYAEVLTTTAIADYDGRPGALSSGSPECAASIGTTLANFPFPDDAATSFSDFATSERDRRHTIAAPGMCITSTLPGGAYGLESGTSMAAPHVAGVVALCIASGRCAGKSTAEVMQTLISDAADYGVTHRG